MALHCSRDARTHEQAADVAGLRLINPCIEATFNPDRLLATGERMTLVSKGGLDATTKACYWFGLEYAAFSTAYLLFGFYDATGSALVYLRSAAIAFVPGQWYSALGFFNSVNGVWGIRYAARQAPGTAAVTKYGTTYTGTLAAGEVPYASTQAVRIGSGCTAAGVPADIFEGKIEEVRIWSNEISGWDSTSATANINTRLVTRLAGHERGGVIFVPDDDAVLRLYHRLDDGLGVQGGTAVYDRAQPWNTGPLGNDGTVLNGTAASWTEGASDLYYPRGMWSGALLGYQSLARLVGTVVTTSDEAATHPASNLVATATGKPWRTTGVSGTRWAKWQLPSAYAVGALLIPTHNLSSKAVVHLEWALTDSFGAPAKSELVTVAPGRIWHIPTMPYAYPWVRLTIVDTANPAAYLELKIVLMLVREVRFPAMARSLTIADGSVLTASEHGDQEVRELPSSADQAWSLETIPAAHARDLFDLARSTGSGEFWFWSPNPESQLYSRSTYGPLTGLPTMTIADPSGTYLTLAGWQIEGDAA